MSRYAMSRYADKLNEVLPACIRAEQAPLEAPGDGIASVTINFICTDGHAFALGCLVKVIPGEFNTTLDGHILGTDTWHVEAARLACIYAGTVAAKAAGF